MNSKPAGYPRFRLFTPYPPGYFFLECSLAGSTCIDASRLIFQSAVSFQIRLVAKKQAGPTRFFAFIPAVKPSAPLFWDWESPTNSPILRKILEDPKPLPLLVYVRGTCTYTVIPKYVTRRQQHMRWVFIY